MKAILKYATAESPLGPFIGGLIASGLLALVSLILWPPFYWLFGAVFGPWFRYWVER